MLTNEDKTGVDRIGSVSTDLPELNQAHMLTGEDGGTIEMRVDMIPGIEMPAMYAADMNDLPGEMSEPSDGFTDAVLSRIAADKGVSVDEAARMVYKPSPSPRVSVLKFSDLSAPLRDELQRIANERGPVMLMATPDAANTEPVTAQPARETNEEEIARLTKELDEAPHWGAAVGAKLERLRGLGAPYATPAQRQSNLLAPPDLKAKASDAMYAKAAEALRKPPETDAIGREIDPGWKDNNPKDAFGTLKAGVTSYLYMPVLAEMAVGMAAGAFKYGAHNYLVVAPRSSVYTDAAIRHIMDYVGGQDWDSEALTKVHHITAAMNSLHVLRSAMINGSYIDDRPPAAPADFLPEANRAMVKLAELCPEPVARYYANGKRGPGRILK